MKICTKCETEYEPRGPAQKYCADCQEIRKIEVRKQRRECAERKRRERGCKVGRGAPRGESHPNYKHGLYVAQTQAPELLARVRYCERCDKDLSEVTKWEWCMHHKDHDHSNHDESNLELLCKRCHQLEHNCIDNLNVQRPSDKE